MWVCRHVQNRPDLFEFDEYNIAFPEAFNSLWYPVYIAMMHALMQKSSMVSATCWDMLHYGMLPFYFLLL